MHTHQLHLGQVYPRSLPQPYGYWLRGGVLHRCIRRYSYYSAHSRAVEIEFQHAKETHLDIHAGPGIIVSSRI